MNKQPTGGSCGCWRHLIFARNPRIGHTRKDLTDQPVLFWPVEDYLILYKPAADDNIEIVAVTQGARDIPSYLRKRS